MINKVVRNIFFLSSSQIIARAVGFFYTIFLARALGVESFGVYTFTLAFLYNFIPVADFGIERLVLRDISRLPSKTSFYLSRLLPLRILLWLGAYLAMLGLGLILGRSKQEIFYLAVLGLSLLPYSLTYLIASFQNAYEKMGYMAFANLATIGLTAIIGVAFVILKLSLVWILFAYFLGNLMVVIIFLGKSASWNLSLGWVIDKQLWRKTLAQTWAFAVLTILSVFYLRLSVILVGLLQGPYLTGIYGSAFRFIEAIILIPQSLALALFPLSSRLFVENKEKLGKIYKKALGVLFISSLPFVLTLIVFPKFVVNLTYGQAYSEAIPVLAILGLSLMLFFLNALAGNIILNSTKVNQFLSVVLFYFVVELILSLILIPRYSILGAAWAVVGGEFIALIVNSLFVWRVLRE